MARWTKEEEELLIELRERGLTYGQMVQYFPNRKRTNLSSKYKHLTDPQEKTVIRKAWTTEEEEFLEKHYQESYKFLMDNLPDRTETSIAAKIRKLGLHRPNNTVLNDDDKQFILDNYYSMRQHELAEHLEVDRKVIKRFLSKHSIKQVNNVWQATKFEVDKDNFMTINVTLEKKRVEVK